MHDLFATNTHCNFLLIGIKICSNLHTTLNHLQYLKSAQMQRPAIPLLVGDLASFTADRYFGASFARKQSL